MNFSSVFVQYLNISFGPRVIAFSFKGTVIFGTFEIKTNVTKLNVLFAFLIVRPNTSANEI